jgi:hypothetical protein
MTFDIATQCFHGSVVACNDNGCVIDLDLCCNDRNITATCLACNNAGANAVCAVSVPQIDIGSSTCTPLFLSYLVNWQDLPGNQCGVGHNCCGGGNAFFHIAITT